MAHEDRSTPPRRIIGPVKRILAIVLAGGEGERLSILSGVRAKPAVPFAGKYRIIDFTLSNCVNSDIDDVVVLTQYNPRSLNDHIGAGRPWDLDRSTGGIRMHAAVHRPQPRRRVVSRHRGRGPPEHLRPSASHRPTPCVILAGDHIYKMDYQPFVQQHRRKRADVTIAVKRVPHRRGAPLRHPGARRQRRGRRLAGEAAPAQERPGAAWASTSSRSGPCSHWLSESPHRLRRATSSRPCSTAARACSATASTATGRTSAPSRATGAPTWTCSTTTRGSTCTTATGSSTRVPRSARRRASGPTANVHRSLISHGCQIAGTVERSVLSPGVRVDPGRHRARQRHHVRHGHPRGRRRRPRDHRQGGLDRAERRRRHGLRLHDAQPPGADAAQHRHHGRRQARHHPGRCAHRPQRADRRERPTVRLQLQDGPQRRQRREATHGEGPGARAATGRPQAHADEVVRSRRARLRRGPGRPGRPTRESQPRRDRRAGCASSASTPLERADRDGVASWDLLVDGRRRRGIRLTLILDPAVALVGVGALRAAAHRQLPQELPPVPALERRAARSSSSRSPPTSGRCSRPSFRPPALGARLAGPDHRAPGDRLRPARWTIRCTGSGRAPRHRLDRPTSRRATGRSSTATPSQLAELAAPARGGDAGPEARGASGAPPEARRTPATLRGTSGAAVRVPTTHRIARSEGRPPSQGRREHRWNGVVMQRRHPSREILTRRVGGRLLRARRGDPRPRRASTRSWSWRSSRASAGVLCGIDEAKVLLAHVLGEAPPHEAVVEALADGDDVLAQGSRAAHPRALSRLRALRDGDPRDDGPVDRLGDGRARVRGGGRAGAGHQLRRAPRASGHHRHARLRGDRRRLRRRLDAGRRAPGRPQPDRHHAPLAGADLRRHGPCGRGVRPAPAARTCRASCWSTRSTTRRRRRCASPMRWATGSTAFASTRRPSAAASRPTSCCEVRARLDQAGFEHVRIIVSGGLSPDRIRYLQGCRGAGRLVRGRQLHQRRHADRLHGRPQGDRRQADRQARPHPGRHAQRAAPAHRPRRRWRST